MFIDFRTALAMYNFLTGDSNNERVSYLKQKAEILTEIELFYLLPNQRRWKSWFPEVIYYYANVDRTRISNSKIDKLEKKIDNVDGKIDKVEGKVDTIEEKNNTIDATLQQLLKEIRELKENKK
ncbi:unnamed protein product [Rhizophagus irregularis]|nr:unnamed protein product [Rhizophagus irregularis]